MFSRMFQREPLLSAKAVEIGRVINADRFSGEGAKDYKLRAEGGYQQNGTTYRAIRQLQVAVAQVEWQLFNRVKTEEGEVEKEEITDHQILDLLARPSKYYGRGRFFEQLMGYLKIGGADFILRTKTPVTSADGERTDALELLNLRPDKVKPIFTDNGTVFRHEMVCDGAPTIAKPLGSRCASPGPDQA